MYISHKLAKKITSFLLKNNSIMQEDYSACIYCIDYIIEIVLFFLSTLLISLFFRMPLLCLIYSTILLALRSTCGGYHAKTRTACSILSFSFFVLAFLLSRLYIHSSAYIMLINMFLCFLIIFFQQKTQTINRVFSPAQQRKQFLLRKFFSLLLLLAFMIIYVLEFFSIASMIVSCTNIAVTNILLAKYHDANTKSISI